MILPNQKDAIHKAWLYRLLGNIYDDLILADNLYFKGGTCATMLGYLDRFSVDLDFDYVGDENKLGEIRKRLEKIFKKLGLAIKDKSQNTPQYFLKYENKDNRGRNTLKIDTTFPAVKANKYEPKRFVDIDRIINCQTIETMFANKLVALMDRFQKNNSIAGRDVYDIHHFFINGYKYDKEVITERTKKNSKQFFKELIDFIEKHINSTIIEQDLNSLLPLEKFKKIRKTLKQEVLMFLRDEFKRLSD